MLTYRQDGEKECNMLEIRLTQPAWYMGGYYRLHTDDGKPSVTVLHEYYTAQAVDNADNDYDVYWSISNRRAFEAGSVDCCDWDNPDEIYSWHDSKPVTAKIINIRE